MPHDPCPPRPAKKSAPLIKIKDIISATVLQVSHFRTFVFSCPLLRKSSQFSPLLTTNSFSSFEVDGRLSLPTNFIHAPTTRGLNPPELDFLRVFEFFRNERFDKGHRVALGGNKSTVVVALSNVPSGVALSKVTLK